LERNYAMEILIAETGQVYGRTRNTRSVESEGKTYTTKCVESPYEKKRKSIKRPEMTTEEQRKLILLGENPRKFGRAKDKPERE
jgi:hypothetical protein